MLRHCHWGCSLLGIPSVCTAEGQQGRGTVRSRAEARVRIPQDQVFLSIHGLGTPGQGWGALCLKVVRKPSWSSRGVTRVGIAPATCLINSPQLLPESPECLWEGNLQLHLGANDVREGSVADYTMGTTKAPHGGKSMCEPLSVGRWGNCP